MQYTLYTLVYTPLLEHFYFDRFACTFKGSRFFNPILHHLSFPVVQSNPINNYNLPHYFVDCCLAKSMIGRVNEHIAFLLFRAFEMQGEVEEAFGYAVIYKALDPQVTFGSTPQNK